MEEVIEDEDLLREFKAKINEIKQQRILSCKRRLSKKKIKDL